MKDNEGGMGLNFFICLMIVLTITSWRVAMCRIAIRPGSHIERIPLCSVFPLCISFFLFVLRAWAAPAVRTSAEDITLFLYIGMGWILIGEQLFSFLGISVRDDAIERHNKAAIIAVSGGLIGITLCYAGGNIGDGLTVETTFISAALATAVWFGCWLVIEQASGISDAIALEHDRASGWRLAGVLVANGLILARAVAGDWISFEVTLHDLVRDGWPCLVLTAIAIALQKWLRPTPTKLQPAPVACGFAPALIFLLAAVVYLVRLGMWNQTLP